MKAVKIGRANSNDCVLTNPSVSSSHAILNLDASGTSGVLTDLGSTNGTFVNGRRINAPTKVTNVDKIKFGTEEVLLQNIVSKMNKTVIKPVSKSYGSNAKTIGKSPDNSIVLKYDDVSRKHAVLYQNDKGEVIIEDCNSTNGTYVNGVKVTSQILHQGDTVTITRNYPLQWQSYFSASVNPKKPNKGDGKNNQWIGIAASVVAVLAIGIGIWAWMNRSWDKEKVYNEYSSAVCWVYCEYGYQIKVDGNDFTPLICKLLEIPNTGYIHVNGGSIKSGTVGAEGTAFFISDDGKLATNLHITRPWLFGNDVETLKGLTDRVLVLLAQSDPSFNRSEVKVEGNVTSLLVIPNGLPISRDNAVACKEYKGYDDIEKDVAIIQTDTRSIPASVKRVIDFREADITEEAITQGKDVFTIGFPYGAAIGLNSNEELQNQVHGGAVTQNRGEYSFGHDAATAGGASGSPIINADGRLIGIHHAGMTGVTGAQGFNRAIKAKYIVDLRK